MSQNYSVRTVPVEGIDVVELRDNGQGIEVRIAPAVGNTAYEIKANKKNILWFPDESIGKLRERHTFSAVPFLAPWANRIDGDAYWANGKHYLLNSALANLRRDRAGLPIHGLLTFSPFWKLVEAKADGTAAWATSRLEFWRYPELMAQFPFAHNLTMTYRLANGEVEVETTIENLSAESMPVAVGYHPYFRLDDAPRDQWRVHVAARQRLLLDERLIPTGQREQSRFADPQLLQGMQFDDVFGELIRDEDGKARFWFEGRHERVTVTYGPKYTVAVIYSPEKSDFLCFEPMSAITNAFNLAQNGVYKELQSVRPAGEWRESFWIKPTGF